jgi:hypothetical protein
MTTETDIARRVREARGNVERLSKEDSFKDWAIAVHTVDVLLRSAAFAAEVEKRVEALLKAYECGDDSGLDANGQRCETEYASARAALLELILGVQKP